MSGYTAQTAKILDRVLRGRLKKSKASRKLGVTRNTIYKWLAEYKIEKEKLDSLKEEKKLVNQEILKIAASNPKIGPRKIASILSQKGRKISERGVWLILKKNNLNTQTLREELSSYYIKVKQAKDRRLPGHLRLTPYTRKRMIEEVILGGEKVKNVTAKYRVSRKAFAKWKKRYQIASEEGKDILQAMSDQHPEGSRHPRGAGEEKIKAVLGQVVENPKLSSQKIAEKLEFIGNHGVQNILKRNNLNNYGMRLAYSQAQPKEAVPVPVPVEDREKHVLEDFIPSLAPVPPPAKLRPLQAGIRFFKFFFISSLLGLLVASAGIYWIRILEPFPPSAKVGLAFSTIALFMGSVFFLYSLKYYITLAIVLSFSQTEQGAEYQGKGKRRRIINWLLGNSKNGEGFHQKKESGPAGLTPNLEHVVLKRKPYVSIHIPFYNEKRVVERAIKAATNFDYPNYEVILCDDSTDETTQIIGDYLKKNGSDTSVRKNKEEGWILTEAEVRPGVTLKHLHRTSRSGFKGGALKLALRVCDPRTEFISVFDADFVPYPDTLELFLKYFQTTAGTLDFNSPHTKHHTPTTSRIAAVQGYQWHVLNKSENWITRGVRSEYAGSYVIERSGTEIYSGLKQISGAVYMIRRDVLEEVGWETSITEDFQLTLKLYEKGYKVVYTPYIQAPAECVSTLKRLIRQRMRWAEGHSNNIRRMFGRLIFNPKLTLPEKLELLYLSPYYLQAFFFLVGTVSWLISETLFPAQLPFWTSLWGWSLVLTNFISLPLMNTVGMFLEESEERDYQGITSFVALSYILVPFQAYASIKGLIQKEEGPWFRTPKTGHITDVFQRGRFYRFISGILPGRSQVAPAHAMVKMPNSYMVNKNHLAIQPSSHYLSLSTANSQFNSFNIKPRRKKWVGKLVLSLFLILSVTVYSSTKGVPEVLASNPSGTFNLDNTDSTLLSGTNWKLLDNTNGGDSTSTQITFTKGDGFGRRQYYPGNSNTTNEGGNCTSSSHDGNGWLFETPFESGGNIALGTWTIYFNESDDENRIGGNLDMCVWRASISGSALTSATLLFDTNGQTSWPSTDILDGAVNNTNYTVCNTGDTCRAQYNFSADEYLYVEFYNDVTAQGGPSGTTVTSTYRTGNTYSNPRIVTPTVTIPESALVFLAVIPLIPYLVNLWLKKRKALHPKPYVLNPSIHA